MDVSVLLPSCTCEQSFGTENKDGVVSCDVCHSPYVHTDIEKVDAALEQVGVIIRAAENWSPQYRKDRKTFKKLIILEARFERKLRKYFREFAARADNYIDWYAYQSAKLEVNAADNFSVDVIVRENIGDETGFFMQVAFEEIEQAVELGGLAAEHITGRDIGISRTNELVQKTAKNLVARLVGKRVDKDGVIVDNPKAKYRVTDKVRKDIRQSISTSLSLGEDQQTAVGRLRKVISNPKRADIIARTETVNSYQRGLLAMGDETGAVGKEWQTVNWADSCGGNARQGIIPINDEFQSGAMTPVAHPNCRCGMRLIYPEDPSAAELL